MAKLVIGVDIGGTKIEAVLHDGKKVLRSARVPTEADKPYAAILDNIAKAVNEVRTKDVVAVGIGTPGIVHQGRILGAVGNIPAIAKKAVATDLSKRIRLPVVHENDAKLFGLAEARLGAGKGKANVIGLIIGTGVGAGIIVDNRILRGSLGAAGEIGHAPYLENDVEWYSCGPAILRMFKEFGGTSEVTVEQILKRDRKLTPQDKAAAEQSRERAYECIARLTATLINTFNPEVIAYGGGVSKSLDYHELASRTRKYAITASFGNCALKQHAISDSSGAIGAAMLAWGSVK